MAPLLAAKKEKEAKLKSLFNFTDCIAARAESTPVDAVLVAELEKHVHHTFSVLRGSIGDAKSTELDSRGTKIWNLSTKLRRDNDPSETKRLLSLLRVFAALMLDAARQSGRETQQNGIRILKVSLKAAKTCLDSGDCDLCLRVLEKAANYESELSKPENRLTTEDDLAYKRLSGEYFVMRTALAWKQSRLDLAEHMFEKMARLQRHADPATAERLADVLYEMGRDSFMKKQYDIAVRWLERAYDILTEQDLERLSTDAGELRLSIMHHLTRAFLTQRTAESRAKAWDLLRTMEIDFDDKMVVSLLKLELLFGEAELDVEAYSEVLTKILRTAILTDTTLKTLLHHVHKLKDASVPSACRALDEFLEVRVYESGRQDWIEKVVIVRIWLTTAVTDNTSSDSSYEFLENVFRNLAKPLSTPAAHAILTLLWKRIETAFTQAQYDLVEQWCNVAHHAILRDSGDANLGIVSRKGIQCALARHDDVAVRKIFFQMPEATRAAPRTRYLMYKHAIRSNDLELAAECLEIVSRSTKKDAMLLYACVLEAQQSGNRKQGILALQRTIASFGHTHPNGVSLLALLRCTARLIVTELTGISSFDDALVSDLCDIFECATSHAKKAKAPRVAISNEHFTHAELEWFSKNAYNLALKHCTDFDPRSLLRLLQSCIDLIELLRTDGISEDRNELLLRLLFCHFLAAAASVTLARAEDNIEQSTQQYIVVRSEAARFCELLSEVPRETIEHTSYEDLHAKRFELLRFQLECAVRLGSWNELDGLLDECVDQECIQRLEKLADLIFSIHTILSKSNEGTRHQSKLLATIQKVVAQSWRTSGHDIVKVSRWLRCLFAMALAVDAKISLMCLDQAKHLVQQGIDKTRIEEPYPAEEIEWLATTAFNRSVDFYCACDDDGCRLWAEKALGLAQASGETIRLYRTLQDRYSSLRWDGQG